MNLLRIRHAALACALFISQSASAAVNTAHVDAPAAQVHSGRAAAMSDKKQRQRDRSAAPAAAGARRNTEASPHPDESKDLGNAQQGKGQTARANSDRVRSLLNKQAASTRTAVAANRRRAAPTVAGSRGAAATTVVTGGATRASGDPGPGAASPLQGRARLSQGLASAMPNRAAPRAAVALLQNSTARAGTLGGPRALGRETLGGPGSAKAARAGALNGTQMLRRTH